MENKKDIFQKIVFGTSIIVIILLVTDRKEAKDKNVETTKTISEVQENVDKIDDSTKELKEQLNDMLKQLDEYRRVHS